MKYLILALAFAGVAHGQTCTQVASNRAHVCWSAPETNTDGSPIVLALTYDVEQQTGSTWTKVATGISARDWTSGVLAPGTYTFRVIAFAGGMSSDPSATAAKSATNPQPLPPAIQVVQVVIGMDHAPVYKLTQSNDRDERYKDACGYIPVGSACSGNVLYTYRGARFRRVSESDVKPFGTDCSGNVVGPCS